MRHGFVMIPQFDVLISIELSEFLAGRAEKRFVENPKLRIVPVDIGTSSAPPPRKRWIPSCSGLIVATQAES